MAWLVVGAAGMLGTDLRHVLDAHDLEHTDAVQGDIDLENESAVLRAVRGHDVVANCAAWTAVDEAETHEDEAFVVNALAPRLLARAARVHDTRLLQLSTDYVFDGHATEPYTEDAVPAPVSAYGRSKAAGEEAVRSEAPDHALVVRTAWLYGAHGRCFPRTIARVARDQGGVEVVDDQVGQPTWTRDVAELLVRLVQASAPSGTWHATSSGQTSWCGFAKAVVTTAGLSADVVSPIESSARVGGAPRPSYSVLGHDRLHRIGLEPIGDWRDRWAEAGPSVLAADEVD